MRVVTWELLLRRIIDTVEQGLTPQLPTPYLRAQTIAIVSLLSNLAGRAEEKASLLVPQNREIQGILGGVQGLLAEVVEAGDVVRAIGQALRMAYPSPAEENTALRRAIYQAIEALYQWEGRLDEGSLAALRSRIRAHLRRQLDQDLALYHPVRAGRMFRGA